jgi:hypothetical protein
MFISSVRSLSIVSAIFVCLFWVSANAKAMKDTPVPSGTDPARCDFVNFYHDETKNAQGSGKCESDCDCDGTRSCVSGACTGTARPAKLNAETCNNKDYHYNEAWTSKGQIAKGEPKCSGDCECDGLRTCIAGKCNGTAR